MREKNRRRTTPQFLTSGAAASALTAAAFAFLACPAIPGITGGAPAEAALIATFQTGSANPFATGNYEGVDDALISNNGDNDDDANWGAQSGLTTQGNASTQRVVKATLIRFDLTQMQDHYTSISGATLTLYPRGDATQSSYSVYQVSSANADWVEGTGTGTPATDGSATWNNRAGYGGVHDYDDGNGVVSFGDSTKNVAWIGGPGLGLNNSSGPYGYNTTAVATGTTNSALDENNSTITTITLPAWLIESWITDPTDNGGLLFVVNSSSQIGYQSSSHGVAGPALAVTYAVPEPASLALLGVGGLLLLRRRRRGDA